MVDWKNILERNDNKFSTMVEKYCKGMKTGNVMEVVKSLENNLVIDIELRTDSYKGLGITNEMLNGIGPCIDIACSGNKVFNVFNDLYSLKEHARKHHNDTIAAFEAIV